MTKRTLRNPSKNFLKHLNHHKQPTVLNDLIFKYLDVFKCNMCDYKSDDYMVSNPNTPIEEHHCPECNGKCSECNNIVLEETLTDIDCRYHGDCDVKEVCNNCLLNSGNYYYCEGCGEYKCCCDGCYDECGYKCCGYGCATYCEDCFSEGLILYCDECKDHKDCEPFIKFDDKSICKTCVDETTIHPHRSNPQ